MSELSKIEDLKKRKDEATKKLKSLKFSKTTEEELQEIFDCGVSIETSDEFNETPLVKAITANNIDISKYLIRKSANLYATNMSGLTSMMICCKKGYIEIAKILLEKGYNLNKQVKSCTRSPLHLAIDGKNLEIVKWLLENGADVDSETELGWTPLMSAALAGNKDIVLELLKHNADKNHKEKSKFKKNPLSALDIAELYHFDEIAEILRTK